MKMTFDKFNGLLQTMEELGRKQHAAYKLGIDLSDFTDDFYGVINDLLRAVYGDDGYEWISWFMFENDFGRKGLGATIHGKPTCFDALSLWKEIEGEAVETAKLQPERTETSDRSSSGIS